ncbi:MAG: MATE family efflux transporter [Cryomorphaceae bacterium]|nr:MATE family efflux transporter [Cryomorphaceae bacterium]
MISKSIRIIRESLSGAERDYTEGSIPKAVILLAIPMILELSLESVFAVVDMFFVSKLGENAIATVGLTEAVIMIIYSIGIGLSTGATAIVARRTGEKDPAAAANAGAQAIFLAVVISVILSVPSVFFAGDILRLMGAAEDVVRDGAIFTQILLGGNVVILLLFIINGIFRGAGDAAMAMRSLWIASIINIILCPILIHYLGLKGAAIATVIGRGSGVAYQLYHLFGGKGIVKFTVKQLKPVPELIASVIKISWPATLQFIVATGSWIVLTRLVAETGGTSASAGYQIAMRNVMFFILPAWGLSNAAATLVGQNLGAGKIDRAEKSIMLSAKFNAIFMAFVMLLFVIFPKAVISIFTTEPLVSEYAVNALRIIGSGYIFYGIGMVMVQALNGAGDTKAPTVINFVGFWLIQIPLAYFLATQTSLKINGAFMAIPIAETVIALLAWYYLKRGNWKNIQV